MGLPSPSAEEAKPGVAPLRGYAAAWRIGAQGARPAPARSVEPEHRGEQDGSGRLCRVPLPVPRSRPCPALNLGNPTEAQRSTAWRESRLRVSAGCDGQGQGPCLGGDGGAERPAMARVGASPALFTQPTSEGGGEPGRGLVLRGVAGCPCSKGVWRRSPAATAGSSDQGEGVHPPNGVHAAAGKGIRSWVPEGYWRSAAVCQTDAPDV